MLRKTISRAPGEGMEFVLSDETVDRMGDIIDASGWELGSFKSNPIALFAHSSQFPIGTWENVRVEGKRLIGRLKMAAQGTSDRIDELRSLVEQGILRAVSVGFSPIEHEPIGGERRSGMRYKRSELLEVSLVSVPANPAALNLAKQLKISNATMAIAFGEHADGDAFVRRDTSGEHADHPKTSRKWSKSMTTLSERIVSAENDLTVKRDKLAELTGTDEFDVDAVEELNDQITACERSLAALKASEAKIGVNAGTGGHVDAPAVLRRPLSFPQKEVKPFDLIVRAITAQGVAAFGGRHKSLDQVLDERYPGHEATAIVAKADQTIGTTGVSGWASELLETTNAGFLNALTGMSIYPELRNAGVGLSFDGTGTIKLPRRTAGGAGGGFVGEGSPIRVGRITTAAAELAPKKLGVIVPFSRELARRSTPAIESIVRMAILEDTASILDGILLDAGAVSAVRPAGLLNGVSAVASGYGGGDHIAVKEDFKALLAPFIAANAAGNITVAMNPAQGLSIAMMDGPTNTTNWFAPIQSRVRIVESTYATAGRLVALHNTDFYTATGDTPEFDINESATVHMEDTTPLEIVSGTGPTTADPVRSFYQTATVGVRMLMDVSWVMGRPSMVQWIDGTSY